MENGDETLNKFSWINPAIAISDSSIDGEAYFAVRDIPKDELLIVQSGQYMHVKDIDDSFYERQSYHGFQIEEYIYIFPFYFENEPYLDGIFKINHSCNPNAGFHGQVALVSMRDIKAGEEIVFDYAMTDVESHNEKSWSDLACNCQSENCRHTITGRDWADADLQRKYKGYFSTYVASVIAANRT